MHRFLLENSKILDGRITISKLEKVHHIRDVLRLKKDEAVIIFDGKGNEYDCLVETVGKSAVFKVRNRNVMKKVRSFSVAVACALPKKARFDDIVDKLTQLGVDRIIPMVTDRVVVKLDPKKRQSRSLRWKKIAQGASEQSRRNSLPQIEEVKTMQEVISLSGEYGLKCIPTLEGARKTLK